MNAPGAEIPFLSLLRELNEALVAAETCYAVIGGVAAARAGGSRTTGDIDVLVDREGWGRFQATPHDNFTVGADWARHNSSGVSIDVLFAGDDWDLPFVLPVPEEVREWDERAGAWFMRPVHLLALKAAVHRSKLREIGAATAAKDLADVRAILESDPTLLAAQELKDLPAEIIELLHRTMDEIAAYRQKTPRRPPHTSG
jgi:hypothetical protein